MDTDRQDEQTRALQRSADALETIRTLLIFLSLVGLLLAGAAIRYLYLHG